MTPRQFRDLAVIPGLSLLPPNMISPEARVLLVAIAMQESALVTRQQVGGPAFGFYQFEEVGVDAVFSNPLTGQLVASAANQLAIPADEHFYDGAKWNDQLATVIARLILWPDPPALPALGRMQDAYQTYIRTWRPGRPSPGRWPTSYGVAMSCEKAAP